MKRFLLEVVGEIGGQLLVGLVVLALGAAVVWLVGGRPAIVSMSSTTIEAIGVAALVVLTLVGVLSHAWWRRRRGGS